MHATVDRRQPAPGADPLNPAVAGDGASSGPDASGKAADANLAPPPDAPKANAPAKPASPQPAAPPTQAGVSFLRAHRWQLLAVAIVLLGLGAWAWHWWQGAPVTTGLVLRRDFVQTVVASGRVEAPHRVDVGAQITAVVRRVPVVEGQTVAAGDLLVELEAAELDANGRQADIAVLQAQARLRQLQEVQGPVAAQNLRRAQAGQSTARAALARGQDLFGQGFIGQAALDEARKTTAYADAEVSAAQRQLDTTGPAGSDHALALATVAGAQAAAAAARARTAYAAIRAPVGGTLIARHVEAGDVVQPGKLLMTLSPRGRTQLVVAIDERNLALLALGQGALVSADAYPAQRLAATLAYINPGINAVTGAVEVKLDITAPPALLRQDMTVSVDIEVARRPQALVVPIAALRDADAAAWVLRLEGRHAVRRPVQLGLRGGGLAEVIGGLSEGDVVLVGASATDGGDAAEAVEPGARVHPATAAVAAGAASASKTAP